MLLFSRPSSPWVLWVISTGCLLAGLSACVHTPVADGSSVPVTPAATGSASVLSDWRAVRLPGKPLTQYRWASKDGRWGWSAHAEHSASMWRRQLLLPADQVGGVAFSWWVDSLIAGADLSTSGYGDAPVRVMFAFEGDRTRLSMRNQMVFELAETLGGEPMPYATLMYVWANDVAPESIILHPRTDRIRKIVLESGPAHLRQWRDYRRNLAQDFRRAFGEEPGRLTAVAIMTDADNLGASVQAWYADLKIEGLPPLMPGTADAPSSP